MRRFAHGFALSGMALFCLLMLAAPVRTATASEAWISCARATGLVETLRPSLPKYLMAAMSKVESGRPHPEKAARFAWPWTVMAEGRGRYLPSKRAAVAEVKRLQRRGIENIDVGCMQVNLYYHGDAFDSVAQAFDPVHNIAYAAEFLMKLRHTEHSWTRAIAFYHSRTPEHYRRYRRKVRETWRKERRAAYRGESTAQLARTVN